MPSNNNSLLTKRGLALKILSKLLYAIASSNPAAKEIQVFHATLLDEYLHTSKIASTQEIDGYSHPIVDIPWETLLDSIAITNTILKEYILSERFSKQEIRYMCAMICGLYGKEYELITGFKSQYNLSWSIRKKIGMSPKTTNLRNYLQKLSESNTYESTTIIVQK